MRIIAGSKRGTHLITPKGSVSRPVTDRVKESVMSILYNYNLPEDALVADLFSGVGSFGLESLSRGARRVIFIERDRKVFKVLQKNIIKTNFIDNAKALCSDVFKVGAPIDFDGEKYDLVFVDPPFPLTNDVGGGSLLAGLLRLLCDQLKDGAIVTVRTHKTIELAGSYGQLSIIDRRKWGINAVTIMQFNNKNNGKTNDE